MKVLLISTCAHKLSEKEFVLPISNILGSVTHEIFHYRECTVDLINSFDKILICGTSLQDNKYLEDINLFEKLLSNFSGSLLGICSGMQILCSVFGSSVITGSEIGMFEVRTKSSNPISEGNFQAYCLHTKSVMACDNFLVIAETDNSHQIVKHKGKNFFGVLFHPEVRNESVIENFLKI